MANGTRDDGPASARAARLRYSSDLRPGISRRRAGRGFSYRRPDGTIVSDAAVRARIVALAIPPAWTDVWICPDPAGHLQATGRDARGRKQYRYHARWRVRRDDDKFDRLIEFAGVLPRIRERVDADLARPGPAAREGPRRDRPAARADPHPGRQRRVCPAQPLVRPDDAPGSPRAGDGHVGPVPLPRQVREAARGRPPRPPPRLDRPALPGPARPGAVPVRRSGWRARRRGLGRRQRVPARGLGRGRHGQGLPDLGGDGPGLPCAPGDGARPAASASPASR